MALLWGYIGWTEAYRLSLLWKLPPPQAELILNAFMGECVVPVLLGDWPSNCQLAVQADRRGSLHSPVRT